MPRTGRWVSLVVAIVCMWLVPAAYGQNKFKLKPGAEGKVCLTCHVDFGEKLKSKFVHTPLKIGECTGCHSPHAAAHGKLLFASPSKICFKCHVDIIPEKAVSRHKIAVAGECVKCHDPHASNNEAHLVKAGNDLCLGCHKNMAETLTKVKFKHLPVEESCLNCHDPHASEKAPHLLKSAMPEVCLGCHDAAARNFGRQHAGYPVAKANCTSCHNVHGSNTPGILFDTVHPPVASKQCALCHEAATSPTPFKTKRPGFELCRGCHSTMLNEIFGKNRVHWPLLDETGCLNCHAAHASTQQKLLRAAEPMLCAKCHQDIMDWQAKLAAKAEQEKAAAKGRPEKGALTHQPVQEGSCGICHLPHASDSVYLMSQASIIELCGSCHDWLQHSSHPMGPKVVDPRNQNLTVNCLSCHMSHGTGYRYLITFPTPTDLCVQCHKQFRR